MYTAEQIEKVCELVEDGMPLRQAIDTCDLTRGQFYRTLDANQALAERYARSKELQMEAEVMKIVEIADDTTGDVQRDRLRVDARKWIAAKLMPKKYGDRQTLEHEGLPEQPTPEEAAARIAAILKGNKE